MWSRGKSGGASPSLCTCQRQLIIPVIGAKWVLSEGNRSPWKNAHIDKHPSHKKHTRNFLPQIFEKSIFSLIRVTLGSSGSWFSLSSTCESESQRLAKVVLCRKRRPSFPPFVLPRKDSSSSSSSLQRTQPELSNRGWREGASERERGFLFFLLPDSTATARGKEGVVVQTRGGGGGCLSRPLEFAQSPENQQSAEERGRHLRPSAGWLVVGSGKREREIGRRPPPALLPLPKPALLLFPSSSAPLPALPNGLLCPV